MANELTSTAYRKLYRAVVREIGAGARRLRAAYREEVVRTHWNVGRILNQMLDFGEKPSPQNAEAIRLLARDLKRQESFLYGAARFQREYPVMPRTGLSMSHYLLLLSVKDEKLRGRLETKAAREHIGIKQFQVAVRLGLQKRLTQGTAGTQAQGRFVIPVVRGKLYHYRVLGEGALSCRTRSGIQSVDSGSGAPMTARIIVDVGFGIERDVRKGQAGSVAGGHIVRTVKEGVLVSDHKIIGNQDSTQLPIKKNGVVEYEDYSVRVSDSEKDRLYTYQAAVLRVIDGDTLDARINLGFRTGVTSTLRLRGIDCPEMTSTAGRAAAMFVRETLGRCPFIVVKTYIDEQEKFGRMLADLFYKPGEEDPEKVLSEGTFLNQELLDKGYAVPYCL